VDSQQEGITLADVVPVLIGGGVTCPAFWYADIPRHCLGETMKIFDDIVRSDSSPADHQESLARFLNRVHTPYWDSIRNLIEDWFSRLCPDAHPDMRARLRSDDNRQWEAAFWELYLHETLVRAGYEVTCHPKLAGITRRPDFLVGREDEKFILEARAVSAADDKVATIRRRNRVYDALERTESPNFFLGINVEGEGNADLKVKVLRRKLEQWLRGLDPDSVDMGLAAAGVEDALPILEWEDGDWYLVFRAFPKSPSSRGVAGIRPLGMYGPRGGTVDDVGPIRTALGEKGKAYGEPELPFVVAIRSVGITGDDTDIMDSLYGRSQIQFSVSPSGQTATRWGRAADGYWRDAAGWKHRQVSGVLVSHHLWPWTVARDIPTLWEHPNPLHAVRAAPMWRRALITAQRLEYAPPALTPGSLLGLSDPWPPGSPFDPYS